MFPLKKVTITTITTIITITIKWRNHDENAAVSSWKTPIFFVSLTYGVCVEQGPSWHRGLFDKMAVKTANFLTNEEWCAIIALSC